VRVWEVGLSKCKAVEGEKRERYKKLGGVSKVDSAKIDQVGFYIKRDMDTEFE
jgi:hypothetical protein